MAEMLLETIVSVDNLTQAWQHVRGNIRVAQRQRSHGSDAVTVADFEAHWVEAMEELAHELRHGTYRPLPPRRLLLPKRDGGQRAIAILAIRDRVAQRAVYQVLQPLIDPTFLDCSFGFRPYVGVPHALDRVERYRKHGLTWTLHADIQDCFGSIDHQILLGLLKPHIGEQSVLQLIAAWLQAGVLTESNSIDATHWWDASATMLEQLVEWGTDAALMQSEGYGSFGGWPPPYPPTPAWDSGEPFAPSERPLQLRQRALRGVMRNAAMLGLAYGKPAVAGFRRVLPLLQAQRAGRYVGLAGLAALSAVPLVGRLRQERQRGTLQGGALSPLLANVYLDQLDRAMFERGHIMVRYADDLIFLGSSAEAVDAAYRDATTVLQRLRLTFQPSKTMRASFADGVEFLGYTFPRGTSRSEPQWTSFQAAERAMQQLRQQRKRRRRKE